MKNSFTKWFLTPLTFLIAASCAVAPAAAATRGGGGGGGGGKKQINNVNSDVRVNNVRSTSVNNVNVNKNVNVNVNVDNHHGGWDNDYHPVATAVAVTAAVAVTSAAIGSMVRTVPVGCVPVNYRGMIYQQCGNVWYQPQGSQYVVIVAPY